MKEYYVTALEVAETGLSPIVLAARKGLNIEYHFTVEADVSGVRVVFHQKPRPRDRYEPYKECTYE